MTIAKQDVKIEIGVSGNKAKMSYTLNSGKAQQAENAVVKFVLSEKMVRQPAVRDINVRGVDLVRAMAIIQGFKKSIENTLEKLKLDLSTIGFSFYHALKSCNLQALDPTGAIKRYAMNHIDTKLREKVQNPGDLGFIYQILLKSLKLKNSDPEGFIEDMRFAYQENINNTRGIGELKVS